jgi:hypothetical protein
MPQKNHFSHGLLYSVSPQYLARLHIGEGTNNPSELRASGVHMSFKEYWAAFVKKTLRKPV